MGGAVTVLAVDDQAVFRRTARRLLATMVGFELVGEAASGAEALRLAAELRPDLVLLDIRMPGMDGIETARRLARAEPAPAVVLISVGEVPELLTEPLAAIGAVAHLRKQDLSAQTLRRTWAAHQAAVTGPARPDRSAPP